MRITEQNVATALAKAGGVIRTGAHGQPNGECHACVRELRTLALWDAGVSVDWTDRPDGGSPTDAACIALNDGPWSSDEARTEACLPLVYLTESEAVPGWVERYALRTVREILPIALEAVGVDATACREARTLGAARAAADGAAGYAAGYAVARAGCATGYADYAARAGYAAGYADYAARDAARTATRAAARAAVEAASAAADGDAVLRRAVDLLIECHGGVSDE